MKETLQLAAMILAIVLGIVAAIFLLCLLRDFMMWIFGTREIVNALKSISRDVVAIDKRVQQIETHQQPEPKKPQPEQPNLSFSPSLSVRHSIYEVNKP